MAVLLPHIAIVVVVVTDEMKQTQRVCLCPFLQLLSTHNYIITALCNNLEHLRLTR